MKIEFTHDIIAQKVWERLPEEERQLKLVASSLKQRLEDFNSGNGSLLGIKELAAWDSFFPILAKEVPLKKFIADSRKEVEAQQEKEKLINRRLRSRLNIIYIIAGAMLLLAAFFFNQARVIRIQKQKIETEAIKAAQLREAFGADDRQYFIDEGIIKFESGQFQEAIYDFALARFLSEESDTLSTNWIQKAQKGLEAQHLFWVGKWGEAKALIPEVAYQGHEPKSLIKHFRESETKWEELIGFDDLQNHTELKLSSSNLTAIPEQIGEMINLTSIDLEKNQLRALPESITSLKKLDYLDLGENQLEELPQSLGQLTNLQVLDLSYNELKVIPKSIIQLSKLVLLEIDNNILDSLPRGMSQLINLNTLLLANNHLDSLPDDFGQFPALISMNLDTNALQKLPDNFGQMPRLSNLYLRKNDLQGLPNNLGKMENLTELHLEDNKLQSIPESIGTLGALTKLYLEKNQLSTIPSSLTELSILRDLVLRSNKLKELPNTFLDKIPAGWQFFDLRDNDLSQEFKDAIQASSELRLRVIVN